MSKKNTYEYTNLTKSQQDCLSLIESLGIYELRALARVFGDNSPTTLKRNDHIAIVMGKIISGEDLKPIPLRQGRPYKELSNIEGILAELSQLTGKDYSIKSNQSRANSIQKAVSFKQAEEEVIKRKLDPITAKGILCERNNKEFYLIDKSGKFVLVKKDIDARLKQFDYIEGTAVVMNNENEYILDSIESINYQPSKDYQENGTPYTENAIPSKKLSGMETEILLGSRYVVKTAKFIESKNIKNLISSLKKNGIFTLAIIPNAMPEEYLEIESLDFDNAILLDYDCRASKLYESLILLIEHTTRLQQQGKNIALFVEDMTTLLNGVDFAFKSNTKALMGHTETAVDITKRLVMLAKTDKDGKNTTLFTTVDDSDMFDQTFVSSVYKVSKKIEL